MFVECFRKKYLPGMDKYIMHGNPIMYCAGKAPDEKLKINELGAYCCVTNVAVMLSLLHCCRCYCIIDDDEITTCHDICVL